MFNSFYLIFQGLQQLAVNNDCTPQLRTDCTQVTCGHNYEKPVPHMYVLNAHVQWLVDPTPHIEHSKEVNLIGEHIYHRSNNSFFKQGSVASDSVYPDCQDTVGSLFLAFSDIKVNVSSSREQMWSLRRLEKKKMTEIVWWMFVLWVL